MTTGAELPSLEFRTVEEWRKWLDENHSSSHGVWLILARKGTPGRSLTRQEAWEEALCFGWIDSLVKSVDRNTFAQKFTPRKEGSKWSKINIDKVKDLRREGRMRGCGELSVKKGRAEPISRPDRLSREVERLIRENRLAWNHFERLPKGARLDYIHWVMEAKREETRARRAREVITLLTEGKRIGLK